MYIFIYVFNECVYISIYSKQTMDSLVPMYSFTRCPTMREKQLAQVHYIVKY